MGLLNNSILNNSKVMLGLAIVLAFVFPSPSEELKSFLAPVLIIMMALSMKKFNLKLSEKKPWGLIFWMVFLNYVLMPLVIICCSYLFIENQFYWVGFIILASVPPAVGIVPVVYLMKGDVKNSVFSEISCYVFSLVWTPLLIFVFLRDYVNVYFLIKILFLMILVPIILSRFIHKLKFEARPFINVAYAFGIYEIIGLNQSTLLSSFSVLFPVLMVALVVRFFLPLMFHFVPFKYKSGQKIMFVLFSSMKNSSAAIVFSLFLFSNNEVLFPIAVYALTLPFFIFFVELLNTKKN